MEKKEESQTTLIPMQKIYEKDKVIVTRFFLLFQRSNKRFNDKLHSWIIRAGIKNTLHFTLLNTALLCII